MPYRLPLSVEQSWTGYRLVDADGLTVASQAAYTWSTADKSKRDSFVVENFRLLAEAVNKQCS